MASCLVFSISLALSHCQEAGALLTSALHHYSLWHTDAVFLTLFDLLRKILKIPILKNRVPILKNATTDS